MVKLPITYSEIITIIIEWHLRNYKQSIDDIYISRILEKFYTQKHQPEYVELDRQDFYYIYDCINTAANYIDDFKCNRELFWDIHEWIYREYRKWKNNDID